jgi:hypothetical protein
MLGRATSRPYLQSALARRIHPSSSPPTLWAHLPSEQRLAFTASAPLRKTVYLTKPKVDMGGNEMAIEITPRAGQVSSFLLFSSSSSLLASVPLLCPRTC